MTIRYEVFCGDCKMEADMYEDYVQYSDYQDLETELKDLQKKYQTLVDKITNICIEA
jgi:uncharacterized protein YlxW (UPF0749 family)